MQDHGELVMGIILHLLISIVTNYLHLLLKPGIGMGNSQAYHLIKIYLIVEWHDGGERPVVLI